MLKFISKISIIKIGNLWSTTNKIASPFSASLHVYVHTFIEQILLSSAKNRVPQTTAESLTKTQQIDNLHRKRSAHAYGCARTSIPLRQPKKIDFFSLTYAFAKRFVRTQVTTYVIRLKMWSRGITIHPGYP